MKARTWILIAAAAAAGALAACHDATAPVERSAADLHFLRPAAGAPALLDTTVSFWAYTDADAGARLRYAPDSTMSSEDFLEFTVPAGALALRPDGTPFAAHDSIRITIHVQDFSRLIVDFQPSRLTFSAAQPPLLKMYFLHADHDFNGDGVVDSQDAVAQSELALWRQELPGQPWYRLGSTLHVESDEVEATILGFTGYALAY